jgi:hypothetical protein
MTRKRPSRGKVLRWPAPEQESRKRGVYVPFPLSHRRPLVAGLAAQMVAREAADSEAYLKHQLQWWKGNLRRRGVDDRMIERELRALELAVRAQLWRLVLLPPKPRGNA